MFDTLSRWWTSLYGDTVKVSGLSQSVELFDNDSGMSVSFEYA
jgi:hypothetical protein